MPDLGMRPLGVAAMGISGVHTVASGAIQQ